MEVGVEVGVVVQADGVVVAVMTVVSVSLLVACGA